MISLHSLYPVFPLYALTAWDMELRCYCVGVAVVVAVVVFGVVGCNVVFGVVILCFTF